MLTCAIRHKQVVPTKSFAVAWFLFWLLFAGIGAVGYLVYFAFKSSTDCPICRADVYGRQRQSDVEANRLKRDDDILVMAGVIGIMVLVMAIAVIGFMTAF